MVGKHIEVLEGLPAGLGEPVQVSMPAAAEGGRLAFDLAGRPVISGVRLAKLEPSRSADETLSTYSDRAYHRSRHGSCGCGINRDAQSVDGVDGVDEA